MYYHDPSSRAPSVTESLDEDVELLVIAHTVRIFQVSCLRSSRKEGVGDRVPRTMFDMSVSVCREL